MHLQPRESPREAQGKDGPDLPHGETFSRTLERGGEPLKTVKTAMEMGLYLPVLGPIVDRAEESMCTTGVTSGECSI